MDGIHDMGGLQGFGAVPRETDEPVFHAAWERTVFGISATLPFAVPFGDDHFRPAIERMPPLQYLTASYYERWYWAMAAMLEARGIPAGATAATPEAVAKAIVAGASQAQPQALDAPHRFRTGQRVRTRTIMNALHTRLPRYARGRIGTVEREHGAFMLADSNAEDRGPAPQQLYTVVFQARDLWGDEAAAGDSVTLDLWDSYLEPL